MAEREQATLVRDCKAMEIPSGYPAVIPAGAQVTILQTLGGNFTVGLDDGRMVRIDAADADALGKEKVPAPAEIPSGSAGPADEKAVWDVLRTIYDPEIPVNLVDLGLIYRCELKPAESGGTVVDIDMTMTAPGCGMGDVLRADVQSGLLALPGVAAVNVELVWDPPWDKDRMSEAAKLQLGMF
jgi:probable FeS assembly SUF system protein SufT